MTAYDDALDDLADRIRKPSTRAAAGLSWACAAALLPEAEASTPPAGADHYSPASFPRQRPSPAGEDLAALTSAAAALTP